MVNFLIHFLILVNFLSIVERGDFSIKNDISDISKAFTSTGNSTYSNFHKKGHSFNLFKDDFESFILSRNISAASQLNKTRPYHSPISSFLIGPFFIATSGARSPPYIFS